MFSSQVIDDYKPDLAAGSAECPWSPSAPALIQSAGYAPSAPVAHTQLSAWQLSTGQEDSPVPRRSAHTLIVLWQAGEYLKRHTSCSQLSVPRKCHQGVRLMPFMAQLQREVLEGEGLRANNSLSAIPVRQAQNCVCVGRGEAGSQTCS